MDVNKAIRFVMEDKQWISKLLIGALMSVLGFLILPALILQGYLVKVIRHVMNGNWNGLPEWDDWGELLKDGFFVTVAQIVYTLPFILLMIIGGAATGGMASVTGSDDLAAVAATGGGLLLLCLVVLFAVALLFLTPAILIQYAIKDDFSACFRFGEVFDIIPQPYERHPGRFCGHACGRVRHLAGDRRPQPHPLPGVDRRLPHRPGSRPLHFIRQRPSLRPDRVQDT